MRHHERDRGTGRAPWRRAAAILVAMAVGLAVWAGLPAARGLLAPAPSFEPIAGAEGFRRLGAGRVSGGAGVLAGLDAGATSEARRVPDDLCEALFGDAPAEPGTVRMASFSDYACPYCRVLTERLARLAAEPGAGVSLRWHELPLLGEASVEAARGALAAERQGAYLALHRRLMRSGFQTTRDYVLAVAEGAGLDAGRLDADMDAPEVDERLRESRALADGLGVVGTPAIVVGRTLVEGEIGEGELRRLIEAERAEGPPPACR